MKNILFVAFMAMFAQALIAQDTTIARFTISGSSGTNVIRTDELIDFFLEKSEGAFTIHSTTEMKESDFDENTKGIELVISISRYRMRVTVAKLFDVVTVGERFARSYKNGNTISVSWLDSGDTPVYMHKGVGSAEPALRSNTLTLDNSATTTTLGLLDDDTPELKIYHGSGISIDPSPGYREHWYYWNGKWWQEDLPEAATPRLALMWFDDGYSNCAWITNFNMPEDRLRKIEQLFDGEDMVWSNDRAYAIAKNKDILWNGLDIEKVKARMLWAIKKSLK